jgi:hypothetical protein
VNWQDYLATRVVELETELRRSRARARKLTRSRDLWRMRALRKAGLRA